MSARNTCNKLEPDAFNQVFYETCFHSKHRQDHLLASEKRQEGHLLALKMKAHSKA